jgi:hypothetical protein
LLHQGHAANDIHLSVCLSPFGGAEERVMEWP